tara:strand:- start:284 stop:697 length:414 start_codon:yes stop_codon:yes gene_type:complete
MAKKMKFGKAGVQEYAGLTLGAIAASKVSSIKLPINLPAPIQAALPLILGVFLAKKSGFVGSIGKGMIAIGGVKIIGAVAPNLGIGQDAESFELITGADDYALAGANDYALAGAMESVGNTTYALAGVDKKDTDLFG